MEAYGLILKYWRTVIFKGLYTLGGKKSLLDLIIWLTLDLDEGVGLDDAQLGGGHAGEVARLPNIEQRQDILSCRKAAIYIY